MSVTVRVNAAGYDELVAKARVYCDHLGARVEGEAKRLCPVDTGRLRSSIRHTNPVWYGTGWRTLVGTNVNYGLMIELGTRPHTIYPRGKKALYWPGAAHPVGHADHPGNRARPFLRPALARVAG